MMHWSSLHPRHWGITTRLVLVAMVPPFLLSLIVTIVLYLSGQHEAAQNLQDRGQLVVAALAETSQYGVISGNSAFLERNISQLLKADSSIASIEILNANRDLLASQGVETTAPAAVFELPISSSVPDIDLFEDTTGPHASIELTMPPAIRDRPAIGFVRVVMSETPILAEKNRRLILGTLVVLLATLVSGLAGLYLAQKLRAPLAAVMTALRDIRRGHFAISLSAGTGGELGELQSTIVEMAQGLSLTQRELERQVASRTHELQKALDAISEANTEKQRLIARGNALLEDERHRIAVEIHEHLNTSLTVVNRKAQRIASLASSPLEVPPFQDIENLAQEISTAVHQLQTAARTIIKELRPEMIDTLGLIGAVADMTRQLDQLYPACEFTLEVESLFPELQGAAAINAYRLIQEALTNAAKHSQAEEVQIRLAQHDPVSIRIQIIDDGKGFDPTKPPEHSIGLIGMRERVLTLDGTLQIESTAGIGTHITIILPLTLMNTSSMNHT